MDLDELTLVEDMLNDDEPHEKVIDEFSSWVEMKFAEY